MNLNTIPKTAKGEVCSYESIFFYAFKMKIDGITNRCEALKWAIVSISIPFVYNNKDHIYNSKIV